MKNKTTFGSLIVAVVLVFVVRQFINHGKAAKNLETTRADLQAVADGLQQYKLHNYNYPTREQGLQALYAATPDARMWRGPYAQSEKTRDAWGRDFVYETTDAYGFRLISKGPDATLGNEDDIVLSNTP